MSRSYCKDVPVLLDVEPLVDHFRQHGKPTVEAVSTAMCYVGGHAGPALLWRLTEEGLLTRWAVTRHVGAAWSGCESPEYKLGREYWEELFERAGYTVDGRRATRPAAPLVLYRGAPSEFRDGWSWTDDVELAHWFARRPTHLPGLVWQATVEPWRLYARNVAWSERESEYVINTDGLDISGFAIA